MTLSRDGMRRDVATTFKNSDFGEALGRLVDLADAVDKWREAKCQRRCDACDPSFGCFATGNRGVSTGGAMCRKPGADRCEGDNHIADCPAELARQDVLSISNSLALTLPEHVWEYDT